MGKSDLKTLIAETVGTGEKRPSGLTNGFDYPPWVERIQYVLQDGSVVLRKVAFSLGSARSADVTFSGQDVIKMMAGDCVRWLAMPHVLVFGFVMDKPSFVTKAKLPEQRKRDRSSGGGGTEGTDLAQLAMEEYFTEEEPLSLSTEAPGGAWSSVLNCRETRPLFVRFIMRNLVLCLPDVVLDRGKMLLVDFENEEGEAESMRYTRDRATRIGEDAPNRIGEFDVSFLYWSRYLSANIGQAPCLVLTIDTDLLMISLLYAAQTERSDLYMYIQGKRPDTTTWVDSRALVGSLHRRVPGETELESMRGVVNASLLAGSDFTTGFPGIGHRTMYKALLSHGGGRSAVPSDSALLREARQGCRGGGAKRSRGCVDWEAHLRTERARVQFTLEYWTSHISGRGDVHVCPFEAHGDAGPGWRRHEDLLIVEAE